MLASVGATFQKTQPCSSSTPTEGGASPNTKILKFRHHLEWRHGSREDFSNLVEECRRTVAQKSRALANVRNAIGFESHQVRAGCVGSHRIVPEHDLSQGTSGAVERT